MMATGGNIMERMMGCLVSQAAGGGRMAAERFS
jgi:hypothetical protein